MYKLKTKAKKSWSLGERRLARKAIEFALDELDLRVTPVPIDIRLKGKSETDFGDSIDLEYKIVVRLHKNDNWLSTLFHELEHALHAHGLRESGEHLDEGGAKALPRAVARARESTNQPPHGVDKVGARRAVGRRGVVGLLRLLEHAHQAGGGLDALLDVDRGEVPEEGEDASAGLGLHGDCVGLGGAS